MAAKITDHSVAFAGISDLSSGCGRPSDPDVALGGSKDLDIITMGHGGSPAYGQVTRLFE